MTINNILTEYRQKLDYLDLELIIADTIKKPREFVLTYPEQLITKKQETIIKQLVERRIKHEPLAYILGHKEFFGLDFKVNRHTLIPRPETELLVEEALKELQTKNYPLRSEASKLKTTIVDIGTGSGNIIVSLAKQLESRIKNYELRFYGTDISAETLKIAKYNAKKHKVDKKIKFLPGNLLEPILKNKKYIIPDTKYMLIANLPYLSKEIYNSTAPNVKKYEPKSALYSAKAGLDHYEKLLIQLRKIHTTCYLLHTTCYIEISPEQKPKITKLIKSYFPKTEINFYKDLAKRWRVCKFEI